ncbi:glycosyltransferase family 4 protein [Bacillus anthracis]|uniref:glycosyltransferase n=1 Tax=Bacillus anthracis TaxID=1392 RepID=UPI00283C8CE7|nr:glycosyltransferase [Bacillus anthracis]MDR4346528.1 glycosyltransferase family 4 protein [Bacillus anthracis]
MSLLGTGYLPDGTHMPGANPNLNIAAFLKENHIDLHTTVYPGGGLDPYTSVEFLNIVSKHCKTVFSNANEVLNTIPNSIYVPGIINTEFYHYNQKVSTKPIQMIFAAHNAERKGFPLLAQAFNKLDDQFHLHIVGNWENSLHLLTNNNYTFWGMLDLEKLKQLYEQSHVFISCSTKDKFAIDGFPTTAAADAMATGCILVSTNHRNDNRILKPGEDYLKIEADSNSILSNLFWIKMKFEKALEIGKSGAIKMDKYFNYKTNVNFKLSHIF